MNYTELVNGKYIEEVYQRNDNAQLVNLTRFYWKVCITLCVVLIGCLVLFLM